MNDEERGRIYDIVYEMHGLAATLLAASRGDLQDPEKIVEYAATQTDHFADELISCITAKSD